MSHGTVGGDETRVVEQLLQPVGGSVVMTSLRRVLSIPSAPLRGLRRGRSRQSSQIFPPYTSQCTFTSLHFIPTPPFTYPSGGEPRFVLIYNKKRYTMSSRSSAREPDLYAVLEVARDASADDIRRAYKRLAVKWHPDKNPDNREHAEAQFKEVSAAYEILADPNTRTAYDRHGMAGVRGGGGGRTQMHDPFDIFNTFFANDPFASMFSGGGSRRRSTRGMHGMDDGFGRSDPFGGGFGGMGMGMGGMGMNMSQMMQSMMQDGGMGMDGMGGMGGMGNGQYVLFYYLYFFEVPAQRRAFFLNNF